MINYSELSDFEINRNVARFTIGGLAKLKRSFINGSDVVVCDVDEGYFEVDYCNNWADAGQLGEDNNITLQYRDKGEPMAKHLDFYSVNTNPKRAISECYLMMKESKK